ncbi:MAG: c-type cytochrome domain-containing protein [Bdellovibrionales bacterium]
MTGCSANHESLTDDKVEQSQAASSRFNSMYQTVIASKCLSCHDGEGSPHGIDLSSYNSIVNSTVFPPLITPGDPEASSLFLSVEDDGMPLKKEALNFREKLAMFEWIRLGALEFDDVEPETEEEDELPDPEEPPSECEPDEPCD